MCWYLQGILSDDCVLAAALWRNLFNRQCEDPGQLELMVEYVRKQVSFSLSNTCTLLRLNCDVLIRPRHMLRAHVLRA